MWWGFDGFDVRPDRSSWIYRSLMMCNVNFCFYYQFHYFCLFHQISDSILQIEGLSPNTVGVLWDHYPLEKVQYALCSVFHLIMLHFPDSSACWFKRDEQGANVQVHSAIIVFFYNQLKTWLGLRLSIWQTNAANKNGNGVTKIYALFLVCHPYLLR